MRRRRTQTTALLLMILSATVILVSSSSTSTGQPEPLTKILITRFGSGYRADDARYDVIKPYELEIYQRWGVKWVVFYGPPTRAQTDLVHQYGLKALVYMNALSIEYTEIKGLGYDDAKIKDWAQWGSGCVYVKPPSPDPNIPSCAGDSANQVRISPYSGYQGNNTQGNGYFELVLSPRVSRLVDPAQVNADGIFTDVLFLKPDADTNPHFTTRYDEWKLQPPSGSFQDFRYYSIHYYASRMYGLVKSINPSAIVVISNNNVFTRSQRDSIALDISRLQDVSDVLLHEWADVDQVDPASPLNWVNLEINGDPNNNAGLYKVTKPLWSHYLTYQTSRFQTMVDAFNTYNYGYWAYNRYFWDNTYSLDVYVFDSQSSNPVQGATVTLGVNGTSTKSTDGSGHAIFYLRPGTYTISITATNYIGWSGSVSVLGNTQLPKGLQPNFPSFTLSANPASLSTSPSNTVPSTITISSINSFTSQVALSAPNLPTGVTASFNPASPTPPLNGQTTSVLTLTTGPNPSLGVFTINVQGVSGVITADTSISLSIKASSVITLTANPTSINFGESTVVSGSISPAQPSVYVQLSYSKDGTVFFPILSTRTTSTGTYSANWAPPTNGLLTIKASWSGNDQYLAAQTTTQLTVTGSAPPSTNRPMILVTVAKTNYGAGEVVSMTVTVFNPSANMLDASLYITVSGPAGYSHYDDLRILVAPGSQGSYIFKWQISAGMTSGVYRIESGLIPPATTAYDVAYVTIS